MDKSFELHGNMELVKLFEARVKEALEAAGYAETEEVHSSRGSNVDIYEKEGRIISLELNERDASADPVWSFNSDENPDYDTILADAAATLISGIAAAFKDVLVVENLSKGAKKEFAGHIRKISKGL